MKQSIKPSSRKTGRPLSFDPEAALEPAMLLFWRHGYEATSLAELTQSMGITPPSIYAAYGDKKGLFRAVLRRYLARPHTPVELIEQAPSAMAAASTLLNGAVIAYTGTNTPSGCLLASSAIAVSDEAEDIRKELADIRRAIEAVLRSKILKDVTLGELKADTDADALAAYTMAIIQGLSTLARDGATRKKLRSVATIALKTWQAQDNSRSR